jgi:DNA repair protein RadD
MRLRPRQKTFVERSVAALASRGNTLGVAPTGAGKTIMLSAVTGEMIGDGAKACVLAHRDELTAQNRAKFQRVVPGVATSVIDATEKSWGGQVAFAMVPTLARVSNLADMPRLDLLVVDEAHHAVADSYRRIIDRVREANPDARIFGVTATPNRGDRKGLRDVFDNVADQVRLGELIASGHLVPPRTFVIDVGVQDELRSVRKTMSDFDMAEVAGIMDRAPVTDEVIRHWKEKAGDRQTVVFCSTVAHAEHVTDAFRAAGVSAALIHGDLAAETRKAILADYAAGDIRVIVNVAVLTEGWDHPPTSCVVLLRPSSYKSTMIQMVGRGLRTVDPEEHPGIVKTDCVVLDFGTSSLIHGTLEQDVDLDGKTETGEAPTKTCPACEAEIPLAATECPLCGEAFPREDEEAGEGGGRRAALGLHDDRDRPAEAVQLRVGRPLRHGRCADGHGLRGLGRHLLAGRGLVRHRRGEGRTPASARRRRAHGLPRAGRRLAEHPRDRRERLQDPLLAAPAAHGKAAAVPAARVPP